jgi:hypothetical protein
VLVVDEVQRNHLESWRSSLDIAQGRIRLITIGQCDSPDASRIPTYRLKALEAEQMTEIVKGWHPSFPPEHVAFVVRFADGYVKLARLAGAAVAQNPSTNVHGLVHEGDIRGFLNQMNGPGSKRSI